MYSLVATGQPAFSADRPIIVRENKRRRVNPSTGPAALTFNAAATAITGTVTNALGTQVLRFDQAVGTGYQMLAVDLNAQPTGVCFIRVQTLQGLQTLHVAKQ
ncbi:hypothetical protein [Hymenobacter nivis]|uniref:T9SS type A sorting domain-containing protein n=1 Tax=Hymenobacter nivis TaxID=1850093 RepID=A0A2Z3GKU0_9BACT|nr:hypothetical protein [Hymenobacter nivis]AWM31756.1 hypothetical protein DDQ68_02530 [Hymenobacter nivis]